MSSTEYRFDGLEELEAKLAQMIERDFPAEFRQKVLDIAYELQGRVKLHTPYKTGYLQDRWAVGDIVKKGDTYYIEVYTNVEYAAHVEYGHRTRDGKGLVKGSHMMDISLEEVNAQLPGYLRNWLADFLETHDL